MGFASYQNVTLKGISVCVPKSIQENKNLPLFRENDFEKFFEHTGISRRRISDKSTCTSDLCFFAAQKLISDLNWQKDEIDCLILVTQSPDYLIPATSCILQERLGLKKELFALDISLGCSGWVYGMCVISGLLNNGSIKKGLLLVGDTSSKICSSEDKSTYPLFGDAGTATAVEYENSSEGFKFHFATDGSLFQSIFIPDGGYRNPFSNTSLIMQDVDAGIRRNRVQLILDGMNIFSFGISNVPESIKLLSNHFNINLENIDFFIFHQANLTMNEKIRKKLKIPADKVPYTLNDYGNTSSATIPLTICLNCHSQLQNAKKSLICCGFGIGLSWASVYFQVENLLCSTLVEL